MVSNFALESALFFVKVAFNYTDSVSHEGAPRCAQAGRPRLPLGRGQKCAGCAPRPAGAGKPLIRARPGAVLVGSDFHYQILNVTFRKVTFLLVVTFTIKFEMLPWVTYVTLRKVTF